MTMTTSLFTNPATGLLYKVGDVLATKEEVIAFAKAVGWEFCFYSTSINLILSEQREPAFYKGGFTCLPYIIRGFLPHHIAKPATPNPPLTFEEARGLKEVWLTWGMDVVAPQRVDKINKQQHKGVYGWSVPNLIEIDCCVRLGGKVYAHDPSVVPPTEREGE